MGTGAPAHGSDRNPLFPEKKLSRRLRSGLNDFAAELWLVCGAIEFC